MNLVGNTAWQLGYFIGRLISIGNKNGEVSNLTMRVNAIKKYIEFKTNSQGYYSKLVKLKDFMCLSVFT